MGIKPKNVIEDPSLNKSKSESGSNDERNDGSKKSKSPKKQTSLKNFEEDSLSNNDTNISTLKDTIYTNFKEKLEMLLDFLLQTGIDFENPDSNPILLLEKLKKVTDNKERNALVNQIVGFIDNSIKVKKNE